MFALMSAVGDVGGWTLDEDRAACESMQPGHYINSSYYEHWLNGIEILLQKHGLATHEEIASGVASAPAKRVTPTPPEGVWPAVTAPGSYERKVNGPPLFKPGERVRARNIQPPAPHAAAALSPRPCGRNHPLARRACVSGFERRRPGRGPAPSLHRALPRRRLWGRDSRDVIHADLWEPYLEAH
jgi:nitrile hydratase subunit beta